MNRIKTYLLLKYYSYKSSLFFTKYRLFTNIKYEDNSISFNMETFLMDKREYHSIDNDIYIKCVTGNIINLNIKTNNFIKLIGGYNNINNPDDIKRYHEFVALRSKLINNKLKEYAKTYDIKSVNTELERWLDNGFEIEQHNLGPNSSCDCLLDIQRNLYVKNGMVSNGLSISSYKYVNINGLYLKLKSINSSEFLSRFNYFMSDVKYTISNLESAMPNYKFDYQIDINDNIINIVFFSVFHNQTLNIDNLIISKYINEHTRLGIKTTEEVLSTTESTL